MYYLWEKSDFINKISNMNSIDENKYQTIRGYNLEKYEYNYHSSKKD